MTPKSARLIAVLDKASFLRGLDRECFSPGETTEERIAAEHNAALAALKAHIEELEQRGGGDWNAAIEAASAVARGVGSIFTADDILKLRRDSGIPAHLSYR